MDTDINQKILQIEEKIDKIYISTEKTRKYFFWTMVISVALFVLPLIGILFVLPSFIRNYTGQIQGLGF